MRKPLLQKVREKVVATLPSLPDADLSHIASLCDGLLRLRAQVKRERLAKVKPQAVGGNAGDEVVTIGATAQTRLVSSHVPQCIEDES